MKEGQGMKSNGSAMILSCDTKEDAIAFLEKDTYAKNGVWDISKVCEHLMVKR